MRFASVTFANSSGAVFGTSSEMLSLRVRDFIVAGAVPGGRSLLAASDAALADAAFFASAARPRPVVIALLLVLDVPGRLPLSLIPGGGGNKSVLSI